MKYLSQGLAYQRTVCWNAWSKVYLSLPRGVKLPLVAIRSLTRSPEGYHGEWAMRAVDPLVRMCEKGVWWIGLVRHLLLTSTSCCCLGTHDLPFPSL